MEPGDRLREEVEGEDPSSKAETDLVCCTLHRADGSPVVDDGVSAGSVGDRLVVVNFEGEDRPTRVGEGVDEGDELDGLGKKDEDAERA